MKKKQKTTGDRNRLQSTQRVTWILNLGDGFSETVSFANLDENNQCKNNLPDIRPRGQGNERDNHNHVGDGGEQVKTEEIENLGEYVEQYDQRHNYGWRSSSFENIFAFVVSDELAEIEVNVL